MPQFIPLAVGLGSAALGAFGGKGKQASTEQTQSQNQSFNTNQEQAGLQNIDQLNQALEDPKFSMFRTNLLPLFSQEFKKSQQPIFGEAAKAKHISDLNDLAEASKQSLMATLGSGGVLGSGRYNQGMENIEMGRFSKIADLFSQLPMMEASRREQNAANLLSMGMNFAGRAPVSQRVSGTQQTEQKGTSQGTSSGMSQGSGSQSGPGFLSGFANNLGGLGGYYFDKMWGLPNTVDPKQSSVIYDQWGRRN
jgi:hypothetical protein